MNHPRIRRRPAVRSTLVALVVLAVAAGCGEAEEPPVPAPPPAGATATATADVGTDALGTDPAAPSSGEPGALAGAGSVPACDLVSKSEAERLAGTPLGDPVSAAAACTYTGPTSGPTAQVEVYVGDGAKKQLDIERELGHRLDPLTGVGDEAYVWVDGAMVFVGEGDRWFSIRLVLLDDPAKHRKPLEELARVAASRF